MNKIVSLFCGIIFGIGLVVSEMINPAKVLGFLNLFDAWDPSLRICNDRSSYCFYTIISFI